MMFEQRLKTFHTMTCHYPDLSSASDRSCHKKFAWDLGSECHQYRIFVLVLKCHFVQKPMVASWNVSCFLRLNGDQQLFSPYINTKPTKREKRSILNHTTFGIMFKNRKHYFSNLYLVSSNNLEVRGSSLALPLLASYMSAMVLAICSTEGYSFMNMRNITRPRMPPWGTPLTLPSSNNLISFGWNQRLLWQGCIAKWPEN